MSLTHPVLPQDEHNAALVANVRPGDWVNPTPAGVYDMVVIGAGTVGCLIATLVSRIQGCDVQLIDVSSQREAVARALGVSFAQPDNAMRDADIVIHASGSPAGLQHALEVAGFEATIVEMSWFGDRPVTLPLGGAFHSKRLTLKSSQVGHVAVSQRARWDTRRRMALAISLLADSSFDALITGESAFDDLPAVMARLADAPGDALCHRIKYAP